MKPFSLKNWLRIGGMLAALATTTASHADKIYFVHNDHLGTPQVITDKNKNVVWEVDRDPWGNITHQIVSTLPNNLSLSWQYADSETGYSQNWNRDYDASIGRYLQSDPIGLAGGINIYGYALQNPVMFTDPTGEFVPLIVPVAAVIVGGAAAYSANQMGGNPLAAGLVAAGLVALGGLPAAAMETAGAGTGSVGFLAAIEAAGIIIDLSITGLGAASDAATYKPKPKPQPDYEKEFCKKNPDASMCKEPPKDCK